MLSQDVITLSEEEVLATPVNQIDFVLTESDAALIVQAKEEAKEAAKDQREAELLNADIEETTVYDLEDHRVIFNRVKREDRLPSEPSRLESVEEEETEMDLEARLAEWASKESIHIVVSGTVDEEGVSELWWVEGGERYRVFTNANFSWFGGVGEFENETTRYSIFSLVTPEPYGWKGEYAENRVTLADFTPGRLEYFVVEEGSNPDAFRGLEAMLSYYSEHHEQMRMTYENNQKLHRARQDYLKENPPKKRDIIINYSKD